MGAEQSSALDVPVPVCLRPISFFLEEGCRYRARFFSAAVPADGAETLVLKRITVAFIQNAFSLLSRLPIVLTDDGLRCIHNFKCIRDSLMFDLNVAIPVDAVVSNVNSQETPFSLLLAEADSVMSIAEDLLREEFTHDAMFNYHIISVYYCLLVSMESATNEEVKLVQQRLLYSTWRSRQLSFLKTNLIPEYFFGTCFSAHYNIDSTVKLGKGSYGTAYLTRHKLTGSLRAVKAMNVENATSYYLRKVHTEISILKDIDHPNIIKLSQVYFGKRTVYLVTNLCLGGELFEVLNSGKSMGYVFKEDRTASMVRDMLSAVNYLHINGIVHRDLKLENFLFEEKSSTSSLILIDFGLSKRFDQGEVMTQRVGSCYYIAPEVLLGHYDYRCDIWSIGVLCYMILSGSPPFSGPSVNDVYEAIKTEEPSFVGSKFKHLSRTCIDFVQRMLVKDPALRMTTVEALTHPFIKGLTDEDNSNKTVLPTDKALMNQSHLYIDSVGSLGTGSLPPQKAEEIVQSMSTYASSPPLFRVIASLVVNVLDIQQIRFLRDEFYALDHMRSGTISLAAFNEGLLSAPSVLCEDCDVFSIFDEVANAAQQGQVEGMTYREYIAGSMCGRLSLDEKLIEEVYCILDVDRQGFLTAATLRKFLGDSVPSAYFDDIIKDGDQSHSGKLIFDDFLHRWKEFQASIHVGNSPQKDDAITGVSFYEDGGTEVHELSEMDTD
jgi:calcium-dependent protein kinase